MSHTQQHAARKSRAQWAAELSAGGADALPALLPALAPPTAVNCRSATSSSVVVGWAAPALPAGAEASELQYEMQHLWKQPPHAQGAPEQWSATAGGLLRYNRCKRNQLVASQKYIFRIRARLSRADGAAGQWSEWSLPSPVVKTRALDAAPVYGHGR